MNIRFGKRLKVITGTLVALMFIVLLVLLHPGFQRWLLLGQLKKHFSVVELESVVVWPLSTTLRGLRLEGAGWSLELAGMDVSYAPWALIMRHVKVENLAVDGLKVMLTENEEKAVKEEVVLRERLPGIFELTEIGWRVSLRELSVAAELVTPDGQVVLKLGGGGLEPGGRGVIRMEEVLLSMGGADSEFESLSIVGELHVTEAERGAITALAWDVKSEATGTYFDENPRLQITGLVQAGKRHELPKGEPGQYPPESFELKVFDLNNDVSEALLLAMSGHYDAEGENLEAHFDLNADNQALNVFTWALGLPDFRGTGEGKLAWDLKTMTGESTMSLEVEVRSLERISPMLAHVGVLRIEEKHSVKVGLDEVVLDSLAVRIWNAAGEEIVSLSTTQDLAFTRLREDEGKLSGFDKPWLSLKVEIPVEWFDGVLGEFGLRGGDLTGRLNFQGNPMEEMVIAVAEPLKAQDVSLVRGGAVVLQRIETSLRPAVNVSPQKIHLALEEASIGLGSAELLRTQASVDVSLGVAESFRAELEGFLEMHPQVLLQADLGDALSKRVQDFREKVQMVAEGLGPSRLWASSRLLAEPKRVTVQELKVSLQEEQGTEEAWLSVKLLQPIKAEVVAEGLSFSGMEGEWLETMMSQLPLRIVGLLLEDWDVDSGQVSGVFAMGSEKEEDGFRVVSKKPLVIEDLTVGPEGEDAWFRGLTMTSNLNLHYQPRLLRLEVIGLELRGEDGVLVETALSAGVALEELRPVKITFVTTGKSWPMALFRQPLLAPMLKHPWEKPWLFSWDVNGELDSRELKLETMQFTLSGENSTEDWLRFQLDETGLRMVPPWREAEGSGMVVLKAFPLDVPLAMLDTRGLHVSSGTVDSGLRWQLGDGKAEVTSVEPMTVFLGAVEKDGDTLIRDLRVGLKAEVKLETPEVSLKVDALNLSVGGDREQSLEGGVGVTLVFVEDAYHVDRFEGSLAGELRPWFAQPIMPENTMSGGRLGTTVSLSDQGEFDLELGIKDFSLRGKEPALTSMEVLGHAKRDEAKAWPGQLTVTLETQGGKTDLSNAFVWTDSADGMRLEIRTEANNVFLADLEALVRDFFPDKPVVVATEDIEQVTEAGSREKKPPYEDHARAGELGSGKRGEEEALENIVEELEEPPASVDFHALASESKTPEVTEVDEKAFWSGLPVTLIWEYVFHEVIYTNYLKLTEVQGGAHVSDEAIRLDAFQAQFHDARITADGGLAWRPEEVMTPYELTLHFDVKDFNLETFFREWKPEDAPRVEGLFRMKIEADGNFPNLDEARNYVKFLVDMESLSGVFRAIPPDSRLAMTTSGAAATVGEVLSWVPTAGVGLGALSRLVASMREIPYNRVALHLERGTDMNIRVESMEVRSPEILLQGKGGILYEEGVDLLHQRLDLSVSMDARGEMASILSGLGLLEGERLENGYWPGFEFRIWGDLDDPQSNFDRIVSDASTGSLTRNLSNPFHGIWGNLKYRGTEAMDE